MENGVGQSVAEEALSSPPSSMSDLSPQRAHLAKPKIRHDPSTFGVSAQPQHHPATPSSTLIAPPATAAIATATASATATSASTPTTVATTASPSSAIEKKPRKKREPVLLPDGTSRERKKPGPKPKIKDPNAPVQPRKKKQKMAADAPTSAPSAINFQQATLRLSKEGKITTDMVGTMQVTNPANLSVKFNNDQVLHDYHSSSNGGPVATPNTPRPASSGQLFDPIRGDTVHAGHASSNRISATSPTVTHHSGRVVPSASAVPSAPPSPLPPTILKSQNPFTAPPNSALVPRSTSAIATSGILANAEMDIDRPVKKTEANSAGSSSNAPTPPPTKQRAKEQTLLLPTGSGLLSGTPFGGGLGTSSTTATSGTNIWLTFPLKGQTNVTINFSREVERKYGFAALHPRLAARNERRRALAAASNALEKAAGIGSADDMSLDLSEPESNVEMGGIDDETSTGAVLDGRKKKKRKAEEYDRADEFIDDTEMAWEEQALMAKDGFFVYSGPLVTEADKPTVERADGTVKRGRGRGRGGTTRGDATGRGRGGSTRGSRGGATVRKPRVTKADRAMMEQEKLEREKMAATLAAKPVPYQASTPV